MSTDLLDRRTIKRVLDLSSGMEITALEFFSNPQGEIWKVRRELEDAIKGRVEPKFVCYFCGQKIKIRGGKSVDGIKLKKQVLLHFAHLNDSDFCPIKTNTKLSRDEILRVKYHGEKESPLHFVTKELIATFLRRNQAEKKGVEFVAIETRHKSSHDYMSWRKPDVSSVYNGKNLVFEIQLSTTFLDVIAAREHFYKEQGTFILWVFKQFSLQDENQRFAQKDIYYSNNRNVFVLDEEAITRSQQENDLYLLCHYQKAFIDYDKIVEVWESSYIKLSDLTFNGSTFKVYYHDFETEYQTLKELLQLKEQQEADREKRRTERIWLEEQSVITERNQFISRLLSVYGQSTPLQQAFYRQDAIQVTTSLNELFIAGYTPREQDIKFLKSEFEILLASKKAYADRYDILYNIAWATFLVKAKNQPLYKLDKIERLLFAILSMKFKKPIGYKYATLLQVAHCIYPGRKNFMGIFLKAAETYDVIDILLRDDKKGKFREKLEVYNKVKPTQDYRFDSTLKILFPDLFRN